MPRLTEKQKESLLADYHAGVNKNRLAIKYDLSPTAVGKICHGIEPKNIDKVDTLTRIANELATQSAKEVDSINAQVAQRVEDLEFFRSASILVAKKAVEKVKKEDLTMFELEKAQAVIGKGKENIYGRVPDTAVQINNTQSQEPQRPQLSKEEWLRLHGVGD